MADSDSRPEPAGGGARYKLLGCEILRTEAEWLLADLGLTDRVSCEWLEMRLHEKPEKLHLELEQRLAACAGHGYAAVFLLFGLCSRATENLRPPPDSRLVIPRVHDCIPLLMGSAQAFRREHAKEAGTFWFSRSWINRPDGGTPEFSGIGAGIEGYTEDGVRKTAAEVRREFTEKYGEENAEYLMETLAESWKANYSRAVYLDWDRNPLREKDIAFVEEYAAKNGWRSEVLPADLRLLRMLLGGPWPEEEFVTVLPGQRLAAANDHTALAAMPDEPANGS